MDLPAQFNRNDVNIISEEAVFQGFFKMKKYRLQFRRFQGDWSAEIDRECMERGGACAVLLYDPIKDVVVLLEQFRVGCLRDSHSPWQYEVVAGMLEEGESIEETVKREAREEADCKIEKLIPILSYYSTPGGCAEKMHLFCAEIDSTLLGGIHGEDDEGENIRLHIVPRQEACSMMTKGRIQNATAIIALQWLQLRCA
jgi:ADP-ribose pyrophosphatase